MSRLGKLLSRIEADHMLIAILLTIALCAEIVTR